MNQGWLKTKNAARYADVSERTFRDWLKSGLKHTKYRGSIRVKPEWIDEFLTGYEVEHNQVDEIVDGVLKEFFMKK